MLDNIEDIEELRREEQHDIYVLVDTVGTLQWELEQKMEEMRSFDLE